MLTFFFSKFNDLFSEETALNCLTGSLIPPRFDCIALNCTSIHWIPGAVMPLPGYNLTVLKPGGRCSEKPGEFFISLFLITAIVFKCFTFSNQLPASFLKGVFTDPTSFNQQNEKAICQEAILTSFGSLKRVAPVKRVRVLAVVAHAQPIVNRVTFLISRVFSVRLETSVHRCPWVEISDVRRSRCMTWIFLSGGFE